MTFDIYGISIRAIMNLWSARTMKKCGLRSHSKPYLTGLGTNTSVSLNLSAFEASSFAIFNIVSLTRSIFQPQINIMPYTMIK